MQDSSCELKQNKRKHWIDLLRGFCMVAILLDHTEIYYTGDNIIGYNYYVANVLVAFFFLSGYLFYKDTPFLLQHKLKAIAQYLLLPYVVLQPLSLFLKLLHTDSIFQKPYFLLLQDKHRGS